ncbi:MAG TPA: PPOX class F420-dependent oxidoreductase [Gaiellales bacterium]|nr:PPOX class F420-dependent oxidoreductase [Gaiellales bacterium]
MPKLPLPPRLDAFLAKPNASVIATLRRDGSPVTVATWYVWEGGRVLVNMDEGRKRLAHLRADPRVSLTVMDITDWSAHVSLQGRVVSIEEDVGLRDIDRIAMHYMGEPYYERGRRRYSAWIEVDTWHAWRPERM